MDYDLLFYFVLFRVILNNLKLKEWSVVKLNETEHKFHFNVWIFYGETKLIIHFTVWKLNGTKNIINFFIFILYLENINMVNLKFWRTKLKLYY